ncbi:MAG: glycosyltransferase [Candidatus Sumerlaeia bacterium]|nr:glycosyltransferase [Candidatus Sumerlaeia bacterium]
MPSERRILFLASYAPSTERPRAYNILRGLARHFRVSLIAQARSESDRAAIESLRTCCEGTEAVPLSRARSLANCLRYLPTPTPLRAAYFFNPAMRRAIARQLSTRRFDLIHVEHMMAAHFALPLRGPLRVFDSIDSIARLQEKIAHISGGLLDRLISLNELPKVRRYEPWLCRQFDAVLASTETDCAALRAPNARVVPNGVDLEFFGMDRGDRVDGGEEVLFYGRLSYAANREALRFLLCEIWPRVRAVRPAAILRIVGPSPPRIAAGAAGEGVVVTGRVEDVRPFIRKARAVVCPARFAVGTQNKILEPMAMGVPVVATREAAAEMAAQGDRDLLVADDAGSFAQQVVRLLDDAALRRLIARNARAYVQTHHDWRAIVDSLAGFYFALLAQQT